MSDPSDAVDTYLAERFKIGLEQTLVDASSGTIAPALVGAVQITCREKSHFSYQDRGTAYHYEGSLSVEGVTYRYRTWIFEDLDGLRFMTDLSEFAPVDWQATVKIGHGG
jgi:hypothetical protein